MTKFVPHTEPDFDTTADGLSVAFRDRGGQHHALVTAQTNPLTGGVEIYAGGLPVTGASYNSSAQNLKKWRAAVARMQSGGANARLAFLGDSTTMGLYSSGSQYAGCYQVSTPVLVAKLLTGRGIAANTASRFGDANVQRANP